MSQTLRYVSEILAGYPDNTQGLIDPVNVRDHAVSYANAVGYIESTTDITIPITSGVAVIINPLLSGVSSVQSGWGVDGNNFFFPDHSSASPNTVIPSGYSKVMSLQCVATFTKQGAGSDNYVIGWVKNGFPFGITHEIRFTSGDAETAVVPEVAVQDISVTSDTFGVQVTGVGTGDDLTLNAINFIVTDSILGSAP